MLWIIFIILFGVPIIGYITERRSWNNGRCGQCGYGAPTGYWIYFASDSQGGRGYKCSANREHTTWISYPFIDPAIPDTHVKGEPQAWRGRGIKRTIRRKKKRT